MMKLKKIPLIALVISFLFFISCNEDNDTVSPEEGESEVENIPNVYVSSIQMIIKSSGDLKTFLGGSGLDIDTDKLVYDVSVWKVEYKTVYKGDTITASTMIFTPETTDTVSTISFQHGTIANNSAAPTNTGINDGSIILYSAIASAGFVAVVPDFIGFGSSSDIVHPYYHEYYTATAIVNAIYASHQLSEEIGLNLDTDLYLTGYSQGGYATMATHKYYEEEGMAFYDLGASFPSSGGYDIAGVQEFFFAQETYDQPFFLGFVAMSYKTSYDWTQPLSIFFNSPYDERIENLFDGSFSGNEINELLTNNIVDLINPAFLNGENDPNYEFIYNAFTENSLVDWAPKIRIFMYHGDADITVPYQNSIDSYNQLIANGASEEIVTFKSLPGGTHFTGVGPWIEEFINELIILEEK